MRGGGCLPGGSAGGRAGGGGGGGAPRARVAEELSLGVGLEGALVLEREEHLRLGEALVGLRRRQQLEPKLQRPDRHLCLLAEARELDRDDAAAGLQHLPPLDEERRQHRLLAAAPLQHEHVDRSLQLQQRVRAPQPAADPLLLALGRHRRVGVGRRRVGVDRQRQEEGVVPRRLRAVRHVARAQPLLAELQRDAQRRGALRAVDHRLHEGAAAEEREVEHRLRRLRGRRRRRAARRELRRRRLVPRRAEQRRRREAVRRDGQLLGEDPLEVGEHAVLGEVAVDPLLDVGEVGHRFAPVRWRQQTQHGQHFDPFGNSRWTPS